MTYVIRHSERVDYAHPERWKKTIRYKENYKDPFITRRGVDIARKATLKILLDMKCYHYEMPKYIYCSPFTRCIETAIVILNTIDLYTDKELFIRIEPGLREQYTPSIIYKQLMDKKMMTKNIINRFKNYQHRFDETYTPIHSYNDMRYNSINPYTEIKRPIDVIQELHNKKDGIIVTHGLNILALYQFTPSDKLYRFNSNEYLTGKDNSSYCSMVKLL